MKTGGSIDKIPPLFVQFSNQTLISKSLCWSLISTNWRMPDERQSLKVKIVVRNGFHEITPQSRCAKMTEVIHLVAGNQGKEEASLNFHSPPLKWREKRISGQFV